MDETQGAPAESTEQATSATPWYGEIADPDLGQWVKNKSFADPATALKSYKSLEQMFGADKAGNTVVLPKDLSNLDEAAPIFQRLGKPETADAYGLTKIEGLPEADAKWAQEIMHKTHLTKAQAETLGKELASYNARQVEEFRAGELQRIANEEAALKQEWGANFEKNVGLRDRAVRAFGIAQETVAAMEKSLGVPAVMKLLANIGAKLSDDGFVAAARSPNTAGNLTPAEAQARIKELNRDPDFRKRIMNGDHGAKRQWDDLMKAIAPIG